MKEEHMERIVDMIDKVLMKTDDDATIQSVKTEVKSLMKDFPLYPELTNTY